jgi:DNA-binding MarR family transcriptional regulator
MPADIVDELELLLDEVTALAGCLRDAARRSKHKTALSRPGRGVLRGLQGQPMTVPQLARRRGTSRQSMQVLVDRLVRNGWVEFVANPDHQRSQRLRLTVAGGRRLESSSQDEAAWLAGLLPRWSERSLRASIGQLRRIRALLLGGNGRAWTADASGGSAPVKPSTPERSRTTQAPRQPTGGVSPSWSGPEPGDESVGMTSLPVTLL